MNTCAGKTIKGAMLPFESDLERSFELFTSGMENCTSTQDIRIYNAAIVINSVCYIEALINKYLEICKVCLEYDDPSFSEIVSQIKKEKIYPEKWNFLKTTTKQTAKWDSSISVFSDFETIASLRNEIVHYKANFSEKGSAPTKRILGLIKNLDKTNSFTTDGEYTEYEMTTWLSYLLESRELAPWIISRTEKLATLVYELKTPIKLAG